MLDHLITLYLYSKDPEMSPGLLTDLRSASVNNECYALSAIRAGLHKHILHASQILYKQMGAAVASFQNSSLESTFGWESETNYPKVGLQGISTLVLSCGLTNFFSCMFYMLFFLLSFYV